MKKIFVIPVLFFLSISLFGIEWGGLFSDDSKLSTDLTSFSVRQSNNISVWTKAAFNDEGSAYFVSQGSFKYYWNISNEDNSFLPILNLDLFKFSFLGKTKNTATLLSVGRFSLADTTGKIFSQPCDGLLLNFTLPRVKIDLYGGYTGMLNSLEISMLGKHSPSEAETIYASSYAYIPASLSFSFPNIIRNQQLVLQFLSFIDPAEDPYNRFYGNVMLSGPVTNSIYYSVTTVLGSLNFQNFMNYSEAFLLFNIGRSFSLSAGASYASGTQAFLQPFVGFTSYTAYNSSLSPELSGVILPTVTFSLIQEAICVIIDAAGVFDFPETQITFKGVNANFSLIGNIFSDLQLKMKVAGFYDLTESGTETNFSVTLSAGLSF